MWLEKKQCSICKNDIIKFKLKEFETMEKNRILCCERCLKYLKAKKGK